MRVGWIDDDLWVLRSAQALLPTFGCHLVTARTGLEGLKLVHDQPLDVLILDHQLPDILGTEVLQRIRTSGSRLPVLYLTSFGNGTIGHEVGELLWTSYREKPLNGEALVADLNRLLERCGRRQPSPTFACRRGSSTASARALFNALNLIGSEPDASQLLQGRLAHVMTDRNTSLFEFVSAGACFKLARSGVAAGELASRILLVFGEAAVHDAESTPALERFLELLRSSGTKLFDLSDATVAVEMGLAPKAFLQWLSAETRLAFSGCKRIMAVRIAILRMAETEEPLKVIAYSLGHSQPRDLDRDFDRFVGITPSGFRSLLGRDLG